ncbi:MAG: cytochrome c biogenesis heme-transporting ATPase CcmA [Betaproteobacteria bacterium]
MLEALDLAAQRGNLRLFSGLGFRVEPGSALVVTGANGTGKTTLLRILAGLCTPTEGRVRWQGEDVPAHAENLRENALYCGHLPALKDELTVEENLRASVELAGEAANSVAALEALTRVELGRQADLPARALSQGQRRRVGLARLALTRRSLWLLDEPTTALDTAGVTRLTQLLVTHLDRGGCAVVATHQLLDLPAARVKSLSLELATLSSNALSLPLS